MYEISGKYELSDYQQANRRHILKQWTITRIVMMVALVIMIILVGYALTMLTGQDVLRWVILFLLALAAAMLLLIFLFSPYKTRKIFYQQKELSLPFQIKFDEMGVHFQNEMGGNNRPWSLFLKWDQNEKIMLLYLSDIMFLMLPKRLLTNEVIAFIQAQLQANRIPRK